MLLLVPSWLNLLSLRWQNQCKVTLWLVTTLSADTHIGPAPIVKAMDNRSPSHTHTHTHTHTAPNGTESNIDQHAKSPWLLDILKWKFPHSFSLSRSLSHTQTHTHSINQTTQAAVCICVLVVLLPGLGWQLNVNDVWTPPQCVSVVPHTHTHTQGQITRSHGSHKYFQKAKACVFVLVSVCKRWVCSSIIWQVNVAHSLVNAVHAEVKCVINRTPITLWYIMLITAII